MDVDVGTAVWHVRRKWHQTRLASGARTGGRVGVGPPDVSSWGVLAGGSASRPCRHRLERAASGMEQRRRCCGMQRLSRRSRPVSATSVGSAVCHRLSDGDGSPYQSVLFASLSLCSRAALLGRETFALHPLSPSPAPTCSLPRAPVCSHSRSSWPCSSSSSPPPPLIMVSDQPPGRPSQASPAQSATQRRRYHHRRAPGSPQTAS